MAVSGVRDTTVVPLHRAPDAGRTPVGLSFSGPDDPLISADVGSRRSGLTSGPYRHDVLGGGHFSTPEIWRALPSRIVPTHFAASGSAS
ncbi:hypothetical protein WEB32_33900 [Streptomyces netropsis]|uniref:hypothetical protein n=1 Tax=Streptomyces netropsis TaxID=55404 RepID=UPI0030CE12CE